MISKDYSLKAYFRIRTLFPQAVRMAVRRSFARRSLRLNSGSWPINPLADRPPDWWAGWPDDRKFAFVITHDVEGTKGMNRCHQVAKMELHYGFRSSFNFVPEGEYEVPTSLRTFLTSHGFEIGIHDLHHDGTLYSSRKNFRRYAQRINRHLKEWGAVGFRSAFMLHNLDWIQDLSILYDSSTFDVDPFEPQPEGVNTIFPFCVGRGNGSSYIELPYTLPQDSTLFLLLRESGIDIWKQKLDWVAKHRGLALVNVHPDYIGLDGTRTPTEYGVHLYQDFLEYVAERYQRDSWCALPKDVATHVHRMNSHFPRPDGNTPSTTNDIESPIEQRNSRTSTNVPSLSASPRGGLVDSNHWRLHGKHIAMVMFSFYPTDPRPRRAAEALVRKGVGVDLICLQEKKNEPKHEVINGINLLRLPVRRERGSTYSYIYQYAAFLFRSATILALRTLTGGYDLIYVHNMPDILVLSALFPKLFGAKVILDLHDPMPELMMTIYGLGPESHSVRLMKWLENRSIALADSVVTVNQACSNLFTSRGCPARKMNIVMNSPDENIFQFRPPLARTTADGAECKPFIIMYHGSLFERNGLDLAVDALAQVRKTIPNAVLRIYGWRTPFLSQVMESVQKYGLQDAVEYLGPKSREQIVEAIQACDIGIIPNQRSIFTELNMPTRIFEYLALGRPVIAPRAQGICEYFEETSLLFFELGNARDLAQKIEYAFSHTAEITGIVKRGQEVYRKHLWRHEELRLISVVSGLLSTGVSPVDSTGLPDRSSRSAVLPPRSLSD